MYENTLKTFIPISLMPPFIGFFAKQQVLSAALDKGYIFLSLVAIITSVISIVYYLNIIKEMFFYSSDYKFNNIFKINDNPILFYNCTNITISSFISFTISTLTLIILLFMLDSHL